MLPNKEKGTLNIKITGTLGNTTKTVSQNYFVKIAGNIGPPVFNEEFPSKIDVAIGDTAYFFIPYVTDPDSDAYSILFWLWVIFNGIQA